MSSFFRVLLILLFWTAVGTVGFTLVEGWSLFESLYMTVITMTTVGYRELRPLSEAGRAFVIVYLIAGLWVFMYIAAQVGELIVSTQLRDWFGKRRMDTALKSLKDHFVVCGFGRMGRRVCRELAERGMSFVAIDRDAEVLAECRERNWPWLVGDATHDEILEAAGIHSAKGLASVLGSDVDNLYVVLSARLLRRELQILARAADEMGATKMEKAGANRVVSLYRAGAVKVAQLLVNPNVEGFIENVTQQGRHGMDLAEIHVSETAPYAGRRLAETTFRDSGIIVISIRRKNGEELLPPPSNAEIKAGDSLLVLGAHEAIRELIQ